MYCTVDDVKRIGNLTNIDDNRIQSYIIIAETILKKELEKKDYGGTDVDILKTIEAMLVIAELLPSLSYNAGKDNLTQSTYAMQDNNILTIHNVISIAKEFRNNAYKLINTIPNKSNSNIFNNFLMVDIYE